jgi:cell division protein FtsQ
MDAAMIAEGWLGRLQRPSAIGRRRRLPRPRVMIAIAAVVALLGCGWLWLRDSSLVAVKRVTITGVSGQDAGQIRSALRAAARNMTTLDVHIDQLKTAVAPYPTVKDLRVTTHFPNAMRIRVLEQTPVGVVEVAGQKIAVASDGTLLHDLAPPASLPAIPVRVPPGGRRLSDPDALRAVAVLAAAPTALLGRISQITTLTGHGLVAQLRDGPSIYLGDGTQAAAKWTAAIAVLADPGSAGASYIDVTDPRRPAAGTGSAGTTSGTAAAGAVPSPTSATSSGG